MKKIYFKEWTIWNVPGLHLKNLRFTVTQFCQPKNYGYFQVLMAPIIHVGFMKFSRFIKNEKITTDVK